MIFPKHLVTEITSEFQFIVVFIILCALLISILWKNFHNQWYYTDRIRQPKTSTDRRRIGPNPTPTLDSANQSPRAQQEHSDVNILLKCVFKGDGYSIWSLFIRYFENVAKLNQLSEQRTRPILLTTLRDQTYAYVNGLPKDVLHNYNWLKMLWLKDLDTQKRSCAGKNTETFRDLGQGNICLS